MKPFAKCSGWLAMMAFLSTPLAATDPAPAPQPQIVFSPGSAGTCISDWEGVAGRTYFFQWSPDLVDWNYGSVIEFGSGPKSYGSICTTLNYFVRLAYEDHPQVTTLQQAENADFDDDGLSNLSEVTSSQTSPLDWDSDGDLVPDSLEFIQNTSPTTNTALDDDDGDGMNNAEEFLAGRNPLVIDPAGDASSRALDVFTLSPF